MGGRPGIAGFGTPGRRLVRVHRKPARLRFPTAGARCANVSMRCRPPAPIASGARVNCCGHPPSHSQRRYARQSRSKPITDALRSCLDAKLAAVSGKSPPRGRSATPRPAGTGLVRILGGWPRRSKPMWSSARSARSHSAGRIICCSPAPTAATLGRHCLARRSVQRHQPALAFA